MHYHTPLKQPSPVFNILQIIPSLCSGGVERAVIETSQGIIQAGHKSFVISSGGPLVKILEKQGAQHFLLPVNSKNPFTLFKNTYFLKKFVQLHNISLIHVRSRAPAWSCFMLEKFLKSKVPWVTSCHGAYETHNFFQWIYSSSMVRSKAVIAVSHFIENYIQRYFYRFKPSIYCIRNGVDLDVFNPKNIEPKDIQYLKTQIGLNNQDPIVIMPARPSPYKGHTILKRALKHIDRPLQILFIGLPKIHRLAKKLKIHSQSIEKHRLFFIEPQQNMPLFYALSDVVILPSLIKEAFGRGAIEAGAMEKIVIASNQGGFQEIILDQETGYLVPSAHPKALAHALNKALDINPDLKKEMGMRARLHIDHYFNLKMTLNQTLELYKKIILG